MEIIKVPLAGEDRVSGWNNPEYLIIHHPEFNGSIERLNEIMRSPSMGFTMIGYNYYVRKDGKVYKGRPDNVTSGNCYNYNHKSLGICFEGNYDKEKEMPKAQFDAGVELIKYLRDKYNISNSKINGHKAYNNTACPGRYFPLDAMLKAIRGGTNTGNVSVSTGSSSSSSKPSGGTKLWEKSISGAEVKALQSEIRKQGFGDIAVDGYFGDATLNACPMLSSGARGNITKLMQQRLLNRGYTSLNAHGGADGVFGAGTVQAVKNLQKNKGLTVDGIVGRDTWRALYSK